MSDYQKDQQANERAVRIWIWFWIVALGVPAAYTIWTLWPIIKFGATGYFRNDASAIFSCHQ